MSSLFTSDILRRAYAASTVDCGGGCTCPQDYHCVADKMCEGDAAAYDHTNQHCISSTVDGSSNQPQQFSNRFPGDTSGYFKPPSQPEQPYKSDFSDSKKSKDSNKQKKSGDKSKKSGSKKSGDKKPAADDTTTTTSTPTPTTTTEPPAKPGTQPVPAGDAFTKFFKPMYDSVCPKYKIPFMCQSPAYFGIGLIVVLFVIVSLLTAKRKRR